MVGLVLKYEVHINTILNILCNVPTRFFSLCFKTTKTKTATTTAMVITIIGTKTPIATATASDCEDWLGPDSSSAIRQEWNILYHGILQVVYCSHQTPIHTLSAILFLLVVVPACAVKFFILVQELPPAVTETVYSWLGWRLDTIAVVSPVMVMSPSDSPFLTLVTSTL